MGEPASESYRAHKKWTFSGGETVSAGDLYRDNDQGPIQLTYRVNGLRDYRRSGLHVVVTVIRREYLGEVSEPMTESIWPVGALFDGRIVRAEPTTESETN